MDIHSIVDLVFMLGSFVFAPALIVSIKRKAKYPAATSLLTAIVLTIFIVCYALIELYLAALATMLTAACWYILLFKRK